MRRRGRDRDPRAAHGDRLQALAAHVSGAGGLRDEPGPPLGRCGSRRAANAGHRAGQGDHGQGDPRGRSRGGRAHPRGAVPRGDRRRGQGERGVAARSGARRGMRRSADSARPRAAALGARSQEAVPQSMKLAAAVLILLGPGRGTGTGTDSLAGRVRQLVDSYVSAYFERHPDEATVAGVAGVGHDRWPDNSPSGIAHWWLREDAWLAELEAIHAESLAGRPEWTAAGIMRDALEGSVGTRLCRFELWNVSHTNGGWVPIVTSLAAAQPVGTAAARNQALARWRAIPRYVATETVNQREGLRVGYTAPQGNVRIVLTQLDTLLATPLQESPLYDPARRDSTPAFHSALARAIEREIVPAMRRYRDFLAHEYLPRARATIGASSNPYGEECYRASIRATTGLELSADSIHRLGLATLAELEDEKRRIAQRSFGASDGATPLPKLRPPPGSTLRAPGGMVAP